jgi:zinc protease
LLAPQAAAIVMEMIKNSWTKRPLSAAAVLAAVGILAACGPARERLPQIGKSSPAPAPALKTQTAGSKAVRGFAFAQEVSDLKPDPAIRFGTLPNGMRYALRHNATPPGQAALRLRFDVGSLMERDDQQGLAHYLEHMAFNGSKTVQAGEMVKILERLGMAFGADTNASTSYDETVYRLDLPKTDAETVDTALRLLRDVGGNLTLDPAVIEQERGVVLSEERARDTPQYKVFQERFAFQLKGQRPPSRQPIGKIETIKAINRQSMADFYQAYYRPERAFLVAVGDFDLDAMEAKIKAAYGDWKATAPDGPNLDPGPVAKRGTEAKVVVQPGIGSTVQMAWINPPDTAPDNYQNRKRLLVRSLGLAVLNRRLSARARSAEPPFISAGASRGDQVHAADIATLAATARPGEWAKALEALDVEHRRALKYGLRQDELDREISEYRSSLQASAASAATRRTPSVAADILGTVADDEVVTNPQQEFEFFESVVKNLKARDVSAAVNAALDGQGPLIFVATPTAIAEGEKAVLGALAASRKLEPTPPAAPLSGAWPYVSFGDIGKVAERTEIPDLDTVFVRFENGVRLTVKPTKFRTEQIFVAVRVGAGLSSMAPDRQNPSWAASAFTEGGLKKVTTAEMEGMLASRNYGVSFGFDDTAFELTGATRPEDLEAQMQVLAAHVAEPGWRPEGFARIRNYGITLQDQLEGTDSGILRRDLSGMLHSGDRRWTFPSREEMAATRLEDLRAVIDPALTSGAIEVVVVGDTTVDKAIDVVAATFGALPARPALQKIATPPGAVRFPAPTATPVTRTHNGRADQAIAYMAWPTEDYFADLRRTRATMVMSDVLKLRLTEELRIKQGATYSPSVGYNPSQTWTGYGYLAASEEAPPALMESFFRDVGKIAASLRDHPVTPDELDRAKKPRIEGVQKTQQTNEYWLDQLSGAQTDPRRLDAIRSALAGVESVTAADVQAVAQRYLRDDKAWKLVIRPKG